MYRLIGCDGVCGAGAELNGIAVDVIHLCRQYANPLRIRSQHLYLEHRCYKQLYYSNSRGNDFLYGDRL